MDLVYYPDHAERYKHLPEWKRRQFPDEVWHGPFVTKREKNLADITPEEARKQGGDILLMAKDVPIRDCVYDGGS